MTSTLELEPLLGLILDQLKAVVAYEGASIFTLDGEALTVVAARRARVEMSRELVGTRFPLARARPIWDMLSRQEPVIIGDLLDVTPQSEALRVAVGDLLTLPAISYIRSWLAVPLALKDRIIGILTVSESRVNAYTPRDATLV